MIDCEKKSKLRCLNCDKKDCDTWEITRILDGLGILNREEQENEYDSK